MNNFSEITNFIWTIAELLRDDFKRSKEAETNENDDYAKT